MKHKNRNYSLKYPRIIAIGFALLILLGSVLLMLPISSKTGEHSFIDCLFTAVSATCVTGLIQFDTYTNWTVFGQIVILTLIQIGGLGFITFIALITKLFSGRISLRQKMLLKDSLGAFNVGSTYDVIYTAIKMTFACEFVGAILLMTQLIPLLGAKKGIYYSIFTSISAFCNAGFDLFGFRGQCSSLTTFNNNPVIILTISALIIIGGTGFLAMFDIAHNKFNTKKISFHTKIILSTSTALLIAGTLLFLIFERNNLFKDMSIGQTLLNAFFASVTPRTAGFNSIDINAMTPASKMITTILMFIGGSSGSTAGGIKTTTFAVLLLSVVSMLKKKNRIEAFNRSLSDESIKRATTVSLLNLSLIFTGVCIISFVQPYLSISAIVLECTSAMGTVGMSAGITSSLALSSKIVIIVLMYIGRLTTLTFALSFAEKTDTVLTTKKPDGKLLIG